jgi:hypothetical protein
MNRKTHRWWSVSLGLVLLLHNTAFLARCDDDAGPTPHAPEQALVREPGEMAGEAYEASVQQFMELLTTDFVAAVNVLDPSGAATNHAGFETMHQHWLLGQAQLGAYVGYEVLSVKRVSSRLHELKVAAYFEHAPTVFTFRLYRPRDKWNFIGGFQWRGDLNEVFNSPSAPGRPYTAVAPGAAQKN